MNNVPFYGDDPFGVGQAPVTPDFGSFQTVGSGKLMVVIFVVDASRSMRGDRIAAVNAALTELMYELKQIQSDNGLDMKISIMTFTSDARWMLQNVPVDEVLLQRIDPRVGLTNYGGAFKELNLVLTKDRFMAHTGKVAPPAIMFMTDGEPSDDYQHDLEILLKNGWFVNANRSAVLIGDAINNPNARIAVEQFVENANEDIVTAEDSSTIVHRLKLATLHTVAGTPVIDGNATPAQGGAAGGQAPSFDPANNPFIDGGNPAVATPPDPNDPFLGGGNSGGAAGGFADPFGDPFGGA
ncbi:MAG: vWA domain-containing protein, partial [Lachnospiraceae bacterium]